MVLVYHITWQGDKLSLHKVQSGGGRVSKTHRKGLTPSTPERVPDLVLQLGATSVKIFGPGILTESEREVRHQAIVEAVAECLKTQSP